MGLLDVAYSLTSSAFSQLEANVWTMLTGQPISVVLIDEAAAHQGIEFCSGDILLLRTGWLKYYFEMSLEERTVFPKTNVQPRSATVATTH